MHSLVPKAYNKPTCFFAGSRKSELCLLLTAFTAMPGSGTADVATAPLEARPLPATAAGRACARHIVGMLAGRLGPTALTR
jgi:hypothetical protein